MATRFGHGSRRYNSSSSIEEVYPAAGERMEDDEEPEIVYDSMSQPVNGTGTRNTNNHRRRRGPRKNERKRGQQVHPSSEVKEEPRFQMNGHHNYYAGQGDARMDMEDLEQVQPEQIVLDDSLNELERELEVELDGSGISMQVSDDGGNIDAVIIPDSEDEDDLVILDDQSKSTSGIGSASSTSGDDPMSVCGDADEIKEITPPHVKASNVAKKLADEKRRTGNMYFGNQKYHEALDAYTAGLDATPDDPTLYTNRSACYMMLKKFKKAQADAREALKYDPKFEKGHIRLLRSSICLGDLIGTEDALRKMKSSLDVFPDTSPEEIKLKELRERLTQLETVKQSKPNEYRTILYLIERALEIAEGDLHLKTDRANALLKLDRVDEALLITTEVIQADDRFAEAFYIRAICFFCQDDNDKAIMFLKQGLQFAPDNSSYLKFFKQVKKFVEVRKEATELFKSRKYSASRQKYQECINILNLIEYKNNCIMSKMYMNLSLTSVKLSETEIALEYVSKAIELNSKYVKAYNQRASIYTTLEKFDEALRDYEKAQQLDPNNTGSYRKFIEDTKLAAKRAKRKDYYKILGVSKNASNDEVKKAYKKRALIHHPDRHSSANDTVKKEQESKFKELGEAYEVLSDQKKRERYDAGHDMLDTDNDFHHNPNDIFNMFFGGQMGRGAYHSRGHTHGFPGSTSYQSNYHPY